MHRAGKFDDTTPVIALKKKMERLAHFLLQNDDYNLCSEVMARLLMKSKAIVMEEIEKECKLLASPLFKGN